MSAETRGWIEDKVKAGERLTREDALRLSRNTDLLFLGRLAQEVKKRKTGDQVFFNVNRHINLTNICSSRCRFCAFSCDPGDPRAYTLTADQAVKIVEDALPLGITEIHLVSALHPGLPFAYYLEVVKRLKERFPHIHLQAFTAVEIKYFSDISGLSIREVLTRLQEAGLGSMPGGGAEIFSPRIRAELCPKKASGEEWIEVMKTAHELGIKSNATMLFGHIETDEEMIDHLLQLRQLQDDTSGFQSFIPLPFHPRHTALSHLSPPSAWEALRVLALSRLVLDNFSHIKAFWIMLGLKVAQLSLEFGVDDLDGTVVEERIVHAAGASTEKGITKERLIEIIRQAGKVPVERDTLYRIIRVY
ncbi:MAG TPA: aminofutalosine synthase MqnE [Thermodesulfobacteriota bacterium]|nr:aminofutalosine synthase MqnE [Thermodesulfobacteriota bacterium]